MIGPQNLQGLTWKTFLPLLLFLFGRGRKTRDYKVERETREWIVMVHWAGWEPDFLRMAPVWAMATIGVKSKDEKGNWWGAWADWNQDRRNIPVIVSQLIRKAAELSDAVVPEPVVVWY